MKKSPLRSGLSRRYSANSRSPGPLSIQAWVTSPGWQWQTRGMKIMVAMSGGVDSSVAASLLCEQGHDVTGVTLKLWDGPSDTGCCSVADVDDAQRVASQLKIPFHVANMSEAFNTHVVEPYVEAHAQGQTPNPCIECNRHLKFGSLLEMMDRLGFDALATGHHARIRRDGATPE